jgi:hypothetical protein
MLSLLLVAFALVVLSSCKDSPAPKASSEIKNLTYSIKRDKTVHFSGIHQGKPVHLVRYGSLGNGKWTVYTGTMTDRVRLVLDDRKGLQEILAMDSGLRMTVIRVGREHTEFRFYAPNRTFLLGSVVFREKNRWRQGALKTEAFAGYDALADVTDVSKSFPGYAAIDAASTLARLKESWNSLNLISVASAQPSLTSQLGQFFDFQTQINYGPTDENDVTGVELIAVASLAGKIATVAPGAVLIAQGVGLAVVGTAMIDGLVVLGSAAVVYTVVDKATDKLAQGSASFYNQFNSAKDVGDDPAEKEAYSRLIKSTAFTAEAEQKPPPAKLEAYLRPAELEKLRERKAIDQMHVDFRVALEAAEACTRKKDFVCAGASLDSASKLAGSYTENELLFAARRNLKKVQADAELASKKTEETKNASGVESTTASLLSRFRSKPEISATTKYSTGFGIGPTKDAACGQARLTVAQASRMPGDCICQQLSGKHICQAVAIDGSSQSAQKAPLSDIPENSEWKQDVTVVHPNGEKEIRNNALAEGLRLPRLNSSDTLVNGRGDPWFKVSDGSIELTSKVSSKHKSKMVTYTGCGKCTVGSNMNLKTEDLFPGGGKGDSKESSLTIDITWTRVR